jgi:hypothetical protein
MVPRVILLLLVLQTATSLALGQDRKAQRGEFHIREDIGRRLYQLSAFAHGHRHGYEAGYLAADEEIHYGHLHRHLQEKDVPGGMAYRREYGDKKRFRRGFEYGFIAGYNDSYDSRPFRLPEWAADVPPTPSVSDLPEADTPGPDRQFRLRFDDGMIDGYRIAAGSQVATLEAPGLAHEAAAICVTEARSDQPGYCDGFVQGFLLGIFDRPTGAVPAARPSETSVGHVP